MGLERRGLGVIVWYKDGRKVKGLGWDLEDLGIEEGRFGEW